LTWVLFLFKKVPLKQNSRLISRQILIPLTYLVNNAHFSVCKRLREFKVKSFVLWNSCPDVVTYSLLPWRNQNKGTENSTLKSELTREKSNESWNQRSKVQEKKNSKVDVMEIFCITRLKRAFFDYQNSCLDKIEPEKLISRASKGLKNGILRLRLGLWKIRAHNY
jgi:hypothetical protein